MITIKDGIRELAGKPEEWVTFCPHCGNKLLTFRGVVAKAELEERGDRRLDGLLMECSCKQAVEERAAAITEEQREQEEARQRELQRRRNRRFENSGMPDTWRSRSLASWQMPGESQRVAYGAAERFLCEAIRPGGKPRSLYIAGDVGTGKTMLASCLARDLHRQLQWVQWANVGTILAELRACYGRGNQNNADEVLNKYKRSAVLVLDDLGKERPTEWAMEQLFGLINHRYNHDLPLIVTANYGGERLVRRLTPPGNGEWTDDTTARAIVDRLREMCETVTLTGGSWRGGAR